MMAQVVFHERRNEKVAVIVTFLAAQRQRLAGIAAGGFEDFGIELIGEEFVRQPLINQDRACETRSPNLLANHRQVTR